MNKAKITEPRLIWTTQDECGGSQAYSHLDGKVVCTTCGHLRTPDVERKPSRREIKKIKSRRK